MTRARASGWLALICAVTFAVYAPSLGNRLGMDDRFVPKAELDSGAHWPWSISTVGPLPRSINNRAGFTLDLTNAPAAGMGFLFTMQALNFPDTGVPGSLSLSNGVEIVLQ